MITSSTTMRCTRYVSSRIHFKLRRWGGGVWWLFSGVIGVWWGELWCGVVWCGVVWCGVVWCGVVWCGVVWCGMVWYVDVQKRAGVRFEKLLSCL